MQVQNADRLLVFVSEWDGVNLRGRLRKRKTLLGLMSNHLAVDRSQTKSNNTLTGMYCTILRFKKDQRQQD